MSALKPEGERDAHIIPFPLHRVTDSSAAQEKGNPAIVHELVSEDTTEVTRKVAKRAHNVSLHALSTTSRSEAEMREKLRSRELPEQAIEEELEELAGGGLLDDHALARDLIERYGNRQKWARRAVVQKLRERKIPASVIDEVLAEGEETDEVGLAEEAGRERLRKMGSLEPAVAKRRLYSFLQRKGFSSSDISQAVAKVLG